MIVRHDEATVGSIYTPPDYDFDALPHSLRACMRMDTRIDLEGTRASSVKGPAGSEKLPALSSLGTSALAYENEAGTRKVYAAEVTWLGNLSTS